MVVLEQMPLEDKYRIDLYAPPIRAGDEESVERWVNEGRPFFDDILHKYWELYRSLLTEDEQIVQTEEEERNERRFFLERQIVVALYEPIEVVGGIWLSHDFSADTIFPNIDGRIGVFHIRVERDHRRIADPLLEYFVRRAKEEYDYLMCHWGERGAEDDPTPFFERNGFSVIQRDTGRSALLRLEKR